MHSRSLALVLVFGLWSPALAGEKFTVQEKEAAPPKEIDAAVAKLLSAKSVHFLNGGGKVVAEVWFRAEVPADATPEQIKNGITYREIKPGELLAAIRFEGDWHDYRKQKVPGGVYTLRLSVQPMDGDHMGMGEFQDYLLLLDAAKDTSAKPLDYEPMVKLALKTIKTGHPGVFMLVPMPAKGKDVEVIGRPRNEWVVAVRREIVVAGKKTGVNFGIGVTLEGHAAE